ncbi:hypothetical protein J6590_055933 [Homalodisca vitripennis]|nr:hypothetical protein J6590_055933 [Homalodisca vitripennis]
MRGGGKRSPDNSVVQQNSTRVVDMDIVYTDMFLDVLNYENDWNALWNDLLDMNTRRHRVLLVLSEPLYKTYRQSGSTSVSTDGRCFVVEPKSLANDESRNNYNKVVYLNVDPFAYALPRTIPGVVVGARGFNTAFDRFTNSPDVESIVVFNTFLMRTESVIEYEKYRQLRVNFRLRVFPVHAHSHEIVCRTACNFCSDAVLSTQQMEVYTVSPAKLASLSRTLGSTIEQNILVSDKLVLLDVSNDRGERYSAVEYYRFKQFYYSLAHGRDNKWGLKLAPGGSLETHLRRWNMMLREELRRWDWVLRREFGVSSVGSSREELLNGKIMQMYAMSPCILNVGGAGDSGLVASKDHYVLDTLMRKYDTSTFDLDGSLEDRDDTTLLAATTVSLNNVFVLTREWYSYSLQLEHNEFFQSVMT